MATNDSSEARAGLNALLVRLAAAGEPGALVYERLRYRCIAFLRLHVPAQAEALADMALDRLARRLQEGTDIESIPLYLLGIARMLVKEATGQIERERRAAAEAARQAELQAPADAANPAHQALESCLASLGAESARLILDYYIDSGATRIARRQQLAAALGLSMNALRNRALRLREKLEECVMARLGAHSVAAADVMDRRDLSLTLPEATGEST